MTNPDPKLIAAMLRTLAELDRGYSCAEIEAQAAALDGMVIVPREEIERAANVLAMVAHPEPSPHAKALRALLAKAQEKDHE